MGQLACVKNVLICKHTLTRMVMLICAAIQMKRLQMGSDLSAEEQCVVEEIVSDNEILIEDLPLFDICYDIV